MQVTNLELIVANVAPVEVLQVAQFEQRPRGTLRKTPHQILSPLVNRNRCLLSKHYLENDLVLLFLYAIDDAEHMPTLNCTLVSSKL